MLTTDQKGSIAEAAVAYEAVKLGIGVFRPISDGEHYDLIFDVSGRLLRVQCKWAARQGDVVAVRCYSCRRTADGLTRRTYTSSEVDAFAAHCPELERCFFLPFERFPQHRQIQLRLAPARNNQQQGIHWADEYDFRRLDWNALGP